MEAHKLGGWFLIVLGLVNIAHAIRMSSTESARPGPFYALLTAGLITAGTMLLCKLKRANAKP